MIGFIFEHVMINHLADPRSDIKLCMKPLQTLENESRVIISSLLKIIQIDNIQDLSFTEIGLYKPKSSTFPAFDCFISSSNTVYAIQITTKVKRKRLAKLITTFQVLRKEAENQQNANQIQVAENTKQKYTLEMNEDSQSTEEKGKEEEKANEKTGDGSKNKRRGRENESESANQS